MALLIIRSTVSSLIITVLYEHPIMQTIYLVIMDGAIILLLVLLKPFVTLQAKLSQFYFEIITLFVHICAVILSFQDKEEGNEKFRSLISTFIIYGNTILVTGSIGFMFIEIFMVISEKTKTVGKENPPQRASVIEENSANFENSMQQADIMDNTMQQLTVQNPRRLNLSKKKQAGPLDNFHLPSENSPQRAKKSRLGTNMENSIISDINDTSIEVNQQRNDSMLIQLRPGVGVRRIKQRNKASLVKNNGGIRITKNT